ncbi:hypothetical protein [Pseudonocardia sp. H11422]|uniref:hypothetical protein n=1 Tax=Pseudonocardia sp. H11422 TaxID=2835866 RepID=UPI001BDD94C1
MSEASLGRATACSSPTSAASSAYATVLFGDLGADVVEVERPGPLRTGRCGRGAA